MKSLELFYTPLCASVFPPVSETQICTRKRLYYTIGESKYYFYPLCFSLSFYIFSFFCLFPFSFCLPHSDLFIYFCAWLRLDFLLFIFLFQPSCVFCGTKNTAHLLFKLQTDRNAFIILRYSNECLTVIKNTGNFFF